jgi:hypothetical protein
MTKKELEEQVVKLQSRINELERNPFDLTTRRQRIIVNDNGDSFTCNKSINNSFSWEKEYIVFYFEKSIAILPNSSNSFAVQLGE